MKESEHIGKIIVDPRNSNVVYVAAQGPLWSAGGDRGLYKTVDGGATWEKVLEISENTGVSDIVMDPRDPDVIYASAYQRRRHVFTLINGGPESALYKTTNGGESWDKLKSGLPGGDLGRIGLAISNVNPDYVYAIVEAANNSGGFFRTTNRGASWEKRSDYIARSPQYYMEIVCDPKDVDKVYSLDTYSRVTTDGGKNFDRLSLSARHVDDHAMWIDPYDTDHFLIGGDGGIYETWDSGNSWHYKDNLPVTQFYKVSVDNEKPFYYIYGGTQDNNSMGGPSRTISQHGIVNSDWFITNGGDGFESVIDPLDPNIVYAQSQYGWLVRYNKVTGQSIGIKPQEGIEDEAYRWNWDAPLIISPHKNTRLYFAANKLFKSDDRGDTWEVISPDLTRQLDRNKLPVMGKLWSIDTPSKNASTSHFGNIVALDESPLQEGLLYVGTDDGLIQISEDDGKTWNKIESFPGVPELTYVNSITASQHDVNTVYASFNNHKRGDFKPYAFVSKDKGRTWESISSNLPERESVYDVIEDHINSELLFAGTEFGVFFSPSNGNKWIQLKSGLPTIAIRDLEIQQRENDLVLASFGRGFYVLDDYTPLRFATEEVLNKEAHIFPVKDALLYLEKSPLGGGSKGNQGDAYYREDNPPVGATFTYYLKESIKTLKQERQKSESELIKENKDVDYPANEEIIAENLEEKPALLFTIFDAENNVVRRLETSASSGIKRITWDLRYPSPRPAASEFSNNNAGMLVTPGTYKVGLSKIVDGEITELLEPQEFTVKLLNQDYLNENELIELTAFQKEVSTLYSDIQGANRLISELLEKVEKMQVALKQTPSNTTELMAEAKVVYDKIESLDREMNGERSLGKYNINTPPSVSGRIGNVLWGTYGTTSAPTNTQKEQFQIAKQLFEPILKELTKLSEIDVKNLEAELEKIDAPWTPGRLPK
ncbi:MAG: glycosyl hydrolase [Melioribacteraceae bacterium]|nr:glycosyl hydrolase [Melioribacteraceae bacterium]